MREKSLPSLVCRFQYNERPIICRRKKVKERTDVAVTLICTDRNKDVMKET